MTLITKRPVSVLDRAEPGHWEGDLIFGVGHRRAIGTVVERTSRYLVLLDLIDGWPTERVCELLGEQLGQLPPSMVKTLTWDQGSELSGHQAFTSATGAPVYFCHPRILWERPTNENTNGLLRDYFPKGVDLAGVQQADLDRCRTRAEHSTTTSTRLAHAGSPLHVAVCVHPLKPPDRRTRLPVIAHSPLGPCRFHDTTISFLPQAMVGFAGSTSRAWPHCLS